MKICNCGEVIYTFHDKDFLICPRCNRVIFVNGNKGSENEYCSSGERPEGQNIMGFHG
jgi:hypothetical protein